MTPPDHRAQSIYELIKADQEYVGDDTLMRELFHYVKFQSTNLPEIEAALEIYRDEEFHHLVDALCLVSCPAERVLFSIRLSEQTYRVYQHLFCDVTVFHHTFAMHRYVRSMKDHVPENVMKMYIDALDRGADALLDKYMVGDRPKPDAGKILSNVLNDTYVKFLGHRGYAVTAEEAKAALPWGNTAAALARAVLTIDREDIRAKEGARALDMALKTEDLTRTPEEEGLTLEDIKPDL